MKRTAATMMLLAGLGGCVSPDKTTKPTGLLPSMKDTVAKTTSKTGEKTAAKTTTSGVVQASATTPATTTPSTGDVQQAGFSRIIGSKAGGCADGSCGANGFIDESAGHAGLGHRLQGGCGPHGCGPQYTQSPYGPMVNGLQLGLGHGGILPAPAMGPYGAVAAVGAFGPGTSGGPLYANQRTSIRFANPPGMRISWQLGAGSFTDATPLEAPARYNFPQGSVYRLKLTSIPNRPGVVYYPTLEVYPATPRTITYLSHNAVPIGFTDEDFDQVKAGNLVVKVVYLPHDVFQDQAAVAGADEVVSTRLEPGVDPIVEANRRGTILAVVRIGNIDLQDPNTPAVDAPPGGVMVPTVAPKSAMTMPSMPAMPTAAPVKTPAPLPNAVKMPVSASPVSLPVAAPKK